jgi:hypothetical protein
MNTRTAFLLATLGVLGMSLIAHAQTIEPTTPFPRPSEPKGGGGTLGGGGSGANIGRGLDELNTPLGQGAPPPIGPGPSPGVPTVQSFVGCLAYSGKYCFIERLDTSQQVERAWQYLGTPCGCGGDAGSIGITNLKF